MLLLKYKLFLSVMIQKSLKCFSYILKTLITTRNRITNKWHSQPWIITLILKPVCWTFKGFQNKQCTVRRCWIPLRPHHLFWIISAHIHPHTVNKIICIHTVIKSKPVKAGADKMVYLAQKHKQYLHHLWQTLVFYAGIQILF